MELDERKMKILKAIISTYLETGDPTLIAVDSVLSEAVSLVAFFVDSDFDTEKVCVFPLPIILAESASSVAFDSFELLLEERLE